jgi:hypothetical protein
LGQQAFKDSFITIHSHPQGREFMHLEQYWSSRINIELSAPNFFYIEAKRRIGLPSSEFHQLLYIVLQIHGSVLDRRPPEAVHGFSVK